MKTYPLILALTAFGLIGCIRSEPVLEELPPNMNPSFAPVKMELPSELIGNWETCKVVKGKSIRTKINLHNSLEIRETVFSDEYCQMIESTKERTIISFYYIELNGDHLYAKIQERSLILFNHSEVEAFNAASACGADDWKVKRPKEVLGIPCSNLPRDHKHNLSVFKINQSSDQLSFADLKMQKISEGRQEEERSGAKVINTTNSDVMTEPGSLNVMLVLPPQSETFSVEVSSFSNLHLCDSVINTYQASVNSSASINNLKLEFESQQQKLKALGDDLSQSIEDLMKYVETNNLQQYDEVIRELDKMDEFIEVANIEYRSCSDNCQELWKNIQDLKGQRWEVVKKLRDLGTYRHLVKGYNAHIKIIDRIQESINEQKIAINSKEIKIHEAEEKHLKLFDKLIEMEGATGTLRYTSDWPKNLKTLIKANPQYKFRYADLSKIIMTYRLSGLDNYPTADSVLSFPGLKYRTLVKGRIGLDQYPLAMLGSTKLSLMAACPADDPEAFEFKLKQPKLLEYEMSFTYRH